MRDREVTTASEVLPFGDIPAAGEEPLEPALAPVRGVRGTPAMLRRWRRRHPVLAILILLGGVSLVLVEVIHNGSEFVDVQPGVRTGAVTPSKFSPKF